MSTQAEQTAIRTSIVVEAPVERAFAVFVGGLRPGQAARALDRHGEG
jgi:hypothetical protein